MKQKEVTIQGKQNPVAFDLQTLLNYEENVGHSFFNIDFEHMSLNDRINIIHAAVKSADMNTDLTVEDIKGKKSFDDMNAILAASNAVVILSTDFFPVPEIEKNDDPEQPEQTEGDEKPKN